MDDDYADQVRFQLPVSVGSRYGMLPSGMAQAKSVPANRITISTEVYMKGSIKSITSPTHPTLAILQANSFQERQYLHGQGVQYRSTAFLEQDFVLSIKADGLDVPRCFAERSPTGSVAVQLTLMPQVKLPTIPAQEYIFLVDRSGSMMGDRIDTAKRALVMLLRALPSQGTIFNIFSFGNSCYGLWGESLMYNQQSLQGAVGRKCNVSVQEC